MIITYHCNIENLDWVGLEKYIFFASKEDAQRILKLKQDNDRCLTLAGKILLLHSLKENYLWKDDLS
jgi:phosphopantetheinyl transferase